MLMPRSGQSARWSRRTVLTHSAALGAAAGAAAWCGWPARAEAAPYRANPDYGLRRLDSRWLWRRGCESDQGPHTAIDDKTIIAGWGDGWGIQRPDDEPKAAMGFTRFTGGAAAPVATDLWSDSQSAEIRALSLKPQALLTVDGAVYVYAMGLVDDRDRVLEVVRLIDRRVAAPIAGECLVDHSPPAPPREYVAPLFRRDPGTGRPTKKDRRTMERFRNR